MQIEFTFFVFTILALFCFIANLFIFCVLLSSQKDKAIYASLLPALALLIWSIASLLMRLNITPGLYFWGDISFIAFMLVPFLLFIQTKVYTGHSSNKAVIFFALLTLGLITMVFLDIFRMQYVSSAITGGSIAMYTPGGAANWVVMAPFLVFSLELAHAYHTTSQYLQESMGRARPYLFGAFMLLLLFSLGMFPAFRKYSLDTIGGSVYACCYVYGLRAKKMGALTLPGKKQPSMLISLIVSALAVVPAIIFYQRVLSHEGHDTNMETIEMSAFAIAAMLFVGLLHRLYISLFERGNVSGHDLKLKEFAKKANKLTTKEAIISETHNLLQDCIEARQIHIAAYDAKEHGYCAVNEFGHATKDFVLLENSPLIGALKETQGNIVFDEFVHTAHYKSLYEKDKQILAALDVALITPVFYGASLLAILFLSQKNRRSVFTFDEITLLESAAALASVSLQNAHLAEQIKKEARYDSLTGLYNRRYFMQALKEDFQRTKAHALTVALISLDDFRLYNELYGNWEGDLLLQDFALMLRDAVGERGTVARYSGKEFIISLPFQGGAAAIELVKQFQRNFRDYVNRPTAQTSKFITFSAGVCTYPTSASTLEQLVTYANMTVYLAKRSGKNSVLAYKNNYGQTTRSSAKEKENIVQEYTSTIYALTAAIDAKDHYTFNHSQCVSTYAMQLAKAAGLNAEHVEIVRQAGLLHDIGKIGIPDNILTKKGRLTDTEFAVMRQHVERSIEMIRHLPSLDYVIPLVLGHHERYDGKGYPRGIAGEDIPIGARCLTIVDAFDAMISERSYKTTMPIEAALNEIRINLGKQFDPTLGALFIALVENQKIKAREYAVYDA